MQYFPSPQTTTTAQFRKLAAIAQSSGVYLSVGVTEKTHVET